MPTLVLGNEDSNLEYRPIVFLLGPDLLLQLGGHLRRVRRRQSGCFLHACGEFLQLVRNLGKHVSMSRYAVANFASQSL